MTNNKWNLKTDRYIFVLFYLYFFRPFFLSCFWFPSTQLFLQLSFSTIFKKEERSAESPRRERGSSASQEHAGISVEEDGLVLQQRLGVSQVKGGTVPKMVEWLALGSEEGKNILTELNKYVLFWLTLTLCFQSNCLQQINTLLRLPWHIDRLWAVANSFTSSKKCKIHLLWWFKL